MTPFRDGIFLIVGLVLIIFGYWIGIREQSNTLRLTQNSEFVVENVRADSTGWEYTFRNLQSSPKITTLQVEMDQPVGYAVGDTLRLLQSKPKY